MGSKHFKLYCEDVNGECRDSCKIATLLHDQYLGKIEYTHEKYSVQVCSKDETVTILVSEDNPEEYPSRYAFDNIPFKQHLDTFAISPQPALTKELTTILRRRH